MAKRETSGQRIAKAFAAYVDHRLFIEARSTTDDEGRRGLNLELNRLQNKVAEEIDRALGFGA